MTQWNNSRKVRERIFIQGLLHLDTPTHFGGDETEGSTDMPLLYDAREGNQPLLTGASIAGALRNYLREYEKGYQWRENAREENDQKSWAEALFGHLDDQPDPQNAQRRKRASVHSWLMIDDVLGEFPMEGDATELRDGVAIDPKTRTAERGKKFDLELLTEGTVFPLSFELWVSKENPRLMESLAIALYGLESGQIGLGKRKRRGFGQCHVIGWQVWRYKMNDVEQVLGWLSHKPVETPTYQPNILTLLDVAPSSAHQGNVLHMKATFALDGSLFVRSYGSEQSLPDAVHLRSWRGGTEKPVLPGTSLTGALRGRAHKIANTIGDVKQAKDLIYRMFGPDMDDTNTEAPQASRVLVAETVIEHGIADRVQNRVSIDRFTGGARDTALFNEQPVWGTPETNITIDLRLLNPQPCEVGLLLLLLKDLWTGDLPLGGESSVGRGRLKGREATLTMGEKTWKIEADNERLQFGGNGTQSELQQFVDALHQEMN